MNQSAAATFNFQPKGLGKGYPYPNLCKRIKYILHYFAHNWFTNLLENDGYFLLTKIFAFSSGFV